MPYVVDADFVRAHEDGHGFVLVDARPRVFFDGLRGEAAGGQGPAGHIHGAIALPASDLLTPEFSLKSPEDLAAAFTAAGVGPRDTVVAYCSVGLVANTTLLAAAALGHPVRLYDGSAQEWLALGLPFEK